MNQRQATAAYFGSLFAYYFAATAAAFGVAPLFPAPVAIVVAVCQFAAMSVLTFLTFMYEEDWWNDFKDQNRTMTLGFIGNALAVAVGTWLGLR